MKKQKIEAPIELLIVVCNYGTGEDVVNLLEANQISNSLIFNGEGTVVSDVANLFGFGITERDVVACLVETEKSKALTEILITDIKLNIEETGLIFTLQLSSATKELLEMLNVYSGGNDNEKRN